MPPLAFEVFEAARFAMGDTIRYAWRMRLIEMESPEDGTTISGHPGGSG
jgi:hypothetical protein